ncbi:ribonuclease HI [Sphingosinicella sp. BN140058]|uniref:ribonuclease HI n=1 Tax=Sphingosinicella sp. BN140058 TaxID=1892855 RepID=UPI001013A27A|nr:RNase H family protein [Sphingosinicella sp. BN140058]QAY80305.1 hypothetical protein ETR14_27055 [Sphingosinicella sp. BN140058]
MITIATDGSCIGNPGAGAYGLVAQGNGLLIERAIPVAATTNNEMELRGLLEALLLYADSLQSQGPATILCDSQLAVKGYNEWLDGWRSGGWRKKGGAIAHLALWQEIAFLKSLVGDRVAVQWIRAHQNRGTINDRVDALANACARSQRAVNGPALQDTLDGFAERLAAAYPGRTGTAASVPSPATIRAPGTHTPEDAGTVLSAARRLITDRLGSDPHAIALVTRIDAVLAA